MFESLAGNIGVKARLEKLVSEDSVPQSLIFAGRDGIGKKQFALEIARSFVCTEKTNNLPCGKCAACRRAGSFKFPTSGKKDDYVNIISSEHPDVGMIIPNKNTIYVDAVRHLASEAFYMPYEAGARVFIIDEAEKLGLTQKAAANALLKTLEEPAPTTHIILVTSKPTSLLQTIRSRCQMIRFASVSESEIGEHLSGKGDMSASDAQLAGRIAKGSIAAAMSLDIEVYKALRGKFVRLLEQVVAGTVAGESIRLSEEIALSKEQDGFADSLEILESVVRDLIVVKAGLNENLTHADISDEIMRLASRAANPLLLRWIEEIESVKSALRFNINKKVGADALFVRMAGR